MCADHPERMPVRAGMYWQNISRQKGGFVSPFSLMLVKPQVRLELGEQRTRSTLDIILKFWFTVEVDFFMQKMSLSGTVGLAGGGKLCYSVSKHWWEKCKAIADCTLPSSASLLNNLH